MLTFVTSLLFQLSRGDDHEAKIETMAKRKQVFSYSEIFSKLVFTSVEVHEEARPQCDFCLEVLADSSLKKTKLQRYLESKHKKSLDKNHEFFKSK